MNRMTALTVVALALACCLIPTFGKAQDETAQSLSIHQAIDIALQHSATIKEAQLNLTLAQLQLEAAQATAYIPTIHLDLAPPSLSQDGFSGGLQGTLGAQVSLPWGTKTSVSADLGLQWDDGQSGVTPVSWGLSFSQQLDLSQLETRTGNLATKRSALLDAQVAWTQAQHTVVVTVLKEFGGLLADKVGLDQAQASLKSAQDAQSVAQSRVDAGQASQSDLLNARLSVLEAQIAVSKAAQTYATDKVSFGRQMLGSDDDFQPLAVDLPLDGLQTASHKLLNDQAIPASAISGTTQVRNAQDAVSAAHSALTTARTNALPTLSVQASAGNTGWKVGVGIAFDLFSPDRQINIQIAQAQLDLATERLSAAEDDVRNTILNERTTLENALQSVEQIAVEHEKWTLEETINEAKREAGLLSTQDWDSFQAQKAAFLETVEQNKMSLLVAYINYCYSLGLQVNWEEWVG